MNEVKRFTLTYEFMDEDPKGEYVYAKYYDAALAREAALREDHETEKLGLEYRLEVMTADRDALQQRLTDAEKRASEFEGLLHMSKELLTTISRHGATTKPNDWCDSFKAEVADRIEKIGVALKPVEPLKSQAHLCDGCGSEGWTANCDKCIPY